MIEAAMYVALGFCTAGLIGLAILPAFYRRAARLTEEALRAVNPASYAEVRAAQDQERARHAVELRRVEKRLDAEREKAAKAQIDATRIKAEVEELKKAQRAQLTNLESKVAAQTSDQHAVDLLSAEVTALKEKLSEAEKALAESWTKLPDDKPSSTASKGTDDDDSGWLPARDTMALATITGLEAEVATLKAKLARYEPTVAGQLEADRTEAAKSRLAKLEAQLIDTEAKYVSAQAEVTRLSLMLDAAGPSESEQSRRLQTQLEKLAGENARHFTELKGKERALERMTGQVEKLQKDLASVPALADLRQEFRALAAKLTAADAITVKQAATAPVPGKTAGTVKKPAAAQIQGKGESGTAAKKDLPPVTAPHMNGNGTPPKATPSQATDSPAPALSSASAPTPASAPSKSANIASAAEALVSRIVASNRNKSRAEAESQAAAAAGPAKDSEQSAEADDKTKAAKQKKKDVA
ncbi:hypothetical protein [Roseibium sp. M-1]